MRVLACVVGWGKGDPPSSGCAEHPLLKKALNMKRETGAELIVAVLGEERSLPATQELFALGADQIAFLPAQISPQMDGLYLGSEVEKLVAQETGPIDLVLCDSCPPAGEADLSPQDPFLLTVVSAMQAEGGALRACCETRGLLQIIELRLPQTIVVERQRGIQALKLA